MNKCSNNFTEQDLIDAYLAGARFMCQQKWDKKHVEIFAGKWLYRNFGTINSNKQETSE